MKIIKLLLILALLIPSHSFAVECSKEVSLLNEGEKAPCTGFLFSPDAEKKASQAIDDAKYFKDLSDMYQKRTDLANQEIKILDERLDLYMKSTNELAKEVNRKERQDFWQKTLYFGLGVVATGLIFYGASQVYK